MPSIRNALLALLAPAVLAACTTVVLVDTKLDTSPEKAAKAAVKKSIEKKGEEKKAKSNDAGHTPDR